MPDDSLVQPEPDPTRPKRWLLNNDDAFGSTLSSLAKNVNSSIGLGGGLLGVGLGMLADRARRKKKKAAANTFGSTPSADESLGATTPSVFGASPSADEEYRRGGRVRKFAQGGANEALPETKPPERGVLRRAPIPVLTTTIVIAPKAEEPKAKKKPVKKKKGGAAPKSGTPAAAAPPAPYRKGGHVQVPRGTGVAKRGKGFKGIF
jgi:hypothetical protein